MKNILLVLIILLASSSCNKPLEYKYQDKPQLINCPGADSKLLNEAFYSFYDDITTYYRTKFKGSNDGMSTLKAYANFIYTGAMGEAEYKDIASEHTIKIIEKLKKEKQLWTKESTNSNLNYNSEFVACLFSNIKNNDFKTTILSLKEVSYLSPKILAERFRTSTQEAQDDPNYGMYIILDTYYQYLMGLDLSSVK